MDEIHRQLNDLAALSGTAFQSAETGLLHYFYGKKEAPHQAIPACENLLFALALFRTKTVEGVQEGKKILEKILAYQQQSGLLPFYLHDFPYCYDKYIGTLCLPPLFLIHLHFSMRLGPELEAQVAKSIEKMIEGSLQDAKNMPYPLQVRLGGVLIGAGRHFNHLEWVEKGNVLLNKERLLEFAKEANPEDLGHCLLGAMLAGNTYFDPLLEITEKKWHPYLQSYTGPFDDIHFSEGHQSLTLYDLFMGATQAQPPRISSAHPVLLQGAQLFPLNSSEKKGFSPSHAQYVLGDKWSYSWSTQPCSQIGCYPFVFQWGSPKQSSFLALSAPKAESVVFENGNLVVNLGLSQPLENREDGQELVWYFSEKPGMKMRVNGTAATTFRLGDLVTIEDDFIRLELLFDATAGSYQGHLLKGCMPTETANYGKKRFDAYQWQLSFRTLSRPDNATLKISFKHVPKS